MTSFQRGATQGPISKILLYAKLFFLKTLQDECNAT